MGVIVAFLIVVVATVFFVTGGMGMLSSGDEDKYERPDGLGKTTIGRARYAAEDSACRTQLSQVRQMVMINTEPTDDTRPESLDQISGMPAGYAQCPIGKEPYEYDPATGKVECVHPGHEKY
jgi:hypothetical protein